MEQAQAQTLRLRADETSRQSMLDANTNATPQAWARAATQFEVGLASGGALVDVGNLASVTLEASPSANRDGARVISLTVALASLDNTLTEATWTDGSKQHALFRFTAAQMNFLASGTASANFWIVISALTTAGDPIIFGAGTLQVIDPGTNFTASTPPPNPGAYLTIDQANALFATSAVVAPLVTPYQITTTSGALALPTKVREAIVATGLSGDLSLGLPLAASYSNGQDITITDSAGNSSPGCPVSAVPTGSNHLSGDGEADYTLTGAGKIVLVSNGVDTWSALPRAGIGGVTSANVIGIRKSAGAGSTDTAASGADMASLLAGTNLVPNSLLSPTIGSPTGQDLNLSAGTYGSGGSLRIFANGTYIAEMNGATGATQFKYDLLAGGNLTVSGTITGNEVYRTVSGTAIAVVSASGSTPADKVLGCHRIPGAVSLTIPTLGLPQNTSREFVIFDADNAGTSNPVTVQVADTGDTRTFSASGFVARLRISHDDSGPSTGYFLTVS